jgi:hypothetical protein
MKTNVICPAKLSTHKSALLCSKETTLGLKRLKTNFYIKYYMRKAGNDSPVLKKEIDDILVKLEKLLKCQES